MLISTILMQFCANVHRWRASFWCGVGMNKRFEMVMRRVKQILQQVAENQVSGSKSLN